MRTLACLAFALLALICAVAAQQPPALGDHEFPSISVADLSSINFPADARVVERNYTVFNPVPSVVRAIGYRVAAASNGNTAAGVAVNVITGALTTLGEPSISLAYFGAKAGIAINPTDSNAVCLFLLPTPQYYYRLLYVHVLYVIIPRAVFPVWSRFYTSHTGHPGAWLHRRRYRLHRSLHGDR